MIIGLSLVFAMSALCRSCAPFMQSLNATTGILGVVEFSGLTAYESQPLRQDAYSLARSNAGGSTLSMCTISGALNMYLTFINLFFSLLRQFGNRRS